MAIVNIKGTVSRTFHNGTGAEVTEVFSKRDGSEGKTRWTCWFDSAHGLSEGEKVAVSGLHGDSVDEWSDKQGQVRHSVKRSVNGARLSGDTSPPQPVSEPWGTDTRSDIPPAEVGAQPNTGSTAEVPF